MLPDSLTTIGDYVFYDCTSLKDLELSRNVTTISDNAFKGTEDTLVVKVSEGSVADEYFKDKDFSNVQVFGIKIEDFEIIAHERFPLPEVIKFPAENTAPLNLTWSIADGSVAIINKSNQVMGISVGKTTITVTDSINGYTASAEVNVVLPSSVNLNIAPDKAIEAAGLKTSDSRTLKVTYSYAGELHTITNDKLVFTSSDANVVSVSDTGVITGTYSGNGTKTATITVSLKNDSSRSFTYTVKAIAQSEHNYDSGKVTPPTCTEAGYTTYTCIDCGASFKTDEVAAIGHKWDNGTVTAPTCTAEGYTTYTCANCGGTKTENIVSALGHSYASVVTPPSCELQGYTTYTCTVCGDTYKDNYVDAKGHNYNAVVTAPTCENKGYTTHTCTACGDSYADTYVDALGHNYTSEITKQPTCTEEGVKTFTCSNCGDTYTEAIAATGHSYNAVVTAPTCTESGYTTYTCANCDDSYTADEVAALGHDYNVVVIEPDCTSMGQTEHTCKVCGDFIVTDETPALGHTPGAEATCTDSQLCTVCEVELVPAKGHSYNAVVTAPTCTESGYTTYT